MKKNNIARNLPKVSNTGNNLLNSWLNAAEEILKDVRQRLAILEANRTTATGSSTGQTTIKLPSLDDYERTDNRVAIIDDNSSGDNQYPSVAALKGYISKILLRVINKNIFEEWDLETQSFDDLDAQNGDKFKVIGNGTYDSITLRDGDVIEIYDDEDEELKLFVLIDSRNLMEGIHTTDNLDEGTDHLYFTLLRVLETTLTGMVESTDEIESNDSILVALGKAKGRINHLQQSISFLEFTLEQQITDINFDLDAIHLQLDGIVTDIGDINTSINSLQTALNGNTSSINDLEADIETLQTDLGEAQQAVEDLETAMPDKLNIADLMDAIKDTLPSTTGTYILTAIDGVLSWEIQP